MFYEAKAASQFCRKRASLLIKHPGGRPTKYDPDYCDQLITHMKKGFSFESFAGKIEVSRDTLYEWAKVHAEFSDAKKIATEVCRLWWEEQGIDGLYNVMTKDGQGGNSTVTINATMWIYNMKCRFRDHWGDHQKKEVEVSLTEETSRSISQNREFLLQVAQDKRGDE